jgi:LysM repeat protein
VNVVEAKPGDVILLPIKGALSERDKEILGGLSATGPRQYVVAKGETASQIAAERDIPMSEVNICKHTPAP